MEEAKSPIRLIFGPGDRMYRMLEVIYENDDGSVGSILLWQKDGDFNLIKFIDDGESCVVWEKIPVSATKVSFFCSLFSDDQPNDEPKYKYKLKEVRIRRDWQFKG